MDTKNFFGDLAPEMCEHDEHETNRENANLERRARSAAKRQGLHLRKSRRDGTYQLTDLYTNAMVAGDHNEGFGLSLEEVMEDLAS